jgi:uncharacterized UPF0160 family protein
MERKTKVVIATHNGKFHADDVFAAATLSLILEKEHEVEIVRTRDIEKINKADYVFDVGGVYDPEKKRFDHHQKGGAGVRANGVPYSSIGLVWKQYGEVLTGSQEIADEIDTILVMSIDARDNGIDIVREISTGVLPYEIRHIIRIFRKTWKEGEEVWDKKFAEAVEFAKNILLKQMQVLKDNLEAKMILIEIYNKLEDKRLLIIDKHYTLHVAISSMPEVLLVMFYEQENDTWGVKTVQDESKDRYESKLLFPENWAGKRDAELEEATGVKGSIFCHNRRFLIVAKTKEAAMQLAQMTLNQ